MFGDRLFPELPGVHHFPISKQEAFLAPCLRSDSVYDRSCDVGELGARFCNPNPWGARTGDFESTRRSVCVLAMSCILIPRKKESIATKFWIDIPEWAIKPSRCMGPHLTGRPFSDDMVSIALLSNKAAASSTQQVAGSSTAPNNPTGLTQSLANSHGASGLQTSVPSRSSQGIPVHTQHLQVQPIPLPSIHAERHVFMTTKVGGHYLLSQWDTLRPRQNDKLFFRELRTQYLSLRGSWRYHFGLKRFSHCDFHRVCLR